MTVSPPYHVGVVVGDIQAGMHALADLLGVQWTPVQRRQIRVLSFGEVVVVEMAVAYSLQGPPHVELIERREGTVWNETGLHHLGCWTHDIVAESARFEQSGCPVTMAQVDEDDVWAMAAMTSCGSDQERYRQPATCLECTTVGVRKCQ